VGRCDIVHAHEWGGVFADLVMMNHIKQMQSGLRIAIEPYGGHVWSQLGEVSSARVWVSEPESALWFAELVLSCRTRAKL